MDHVVTLASPAEKFLYSYKRYRYYYTFIQRLYKYTIPEKKCVLHIGCGDGFILSALKPTYALGIDDSSFKPLFNVKNGHFLGSLNAYKETTTFDYIIVSAAQLKGADDIQELFKSLRLFSDSHTRIILEYSWGSLLPITPADMRLFCELSNLEIITEKNELLLPIGVPMVADFLNYIVARLPLVKNLCTMRIFVTRILKQVTDDTSKKFSVSVIIPCKNEAGNIEGAIARTPTMGNFTEFILIDGHSQDGSIATMKNMVTKYPEKKISWFVQTAKGKKNAVEEGFARAQGDIVMILDGDITVIPEELPKFYEALVSGKGECINGTRLVYPMEREAMQPLNWMINWIFGFFISYLIGQRVKDTLCGTKVFFKKDLYIISESKRFFGDMDPFGDFDILCGAAYCNLKILDMPVHYKKRTYGAPGVAFFKSGLLLLSMTFVVFKKLFLRR